MQRVLEPCPSCRRHVALEETSCPMCRAALTPGWAPARRAARSTFAGRAARFAWQVLVVAGASGCGARTGLAVRDAAPPPDAAAARDAGTDSAIARDAGRDAGSDAGDFDAGDMAIYGAPPPDRPEQPMYVIPAPAPARVVRRRRAKR